MRSSVVVCCLFQAGSRPQSLSKISESDSIIFWSRLANRTRISCISVKFGHDNPVKFYDGYQRGKFEVTSNISTVFLNIINSSDSSLYFCGFYMDGRPNLTSMHLKVNGKITIFCLLVLSVHLGLFCLYSKIIVSIVIINNILYVRKCLFLYIILM